MIIDTRTEKTTLSDDDITLISDSDDAQASKKVKESTRRDYMIPVFSNIGLRNRVDAIKNNTTAPTTDIDIIAGLKFFDSTGEKLLTSIAKTIECDKEFGTDDGAMYVGGSLSASTWYHLFLILNDSTGICNYYLDTDTDGANIPTGHTYFCYIWSVWSNGSVEINPFTQYGLYNEWVTPIANYDTNAVIAKTAVSMSSPLGITTKVKFSARLSLDALASVLLSKFFSANQADVVINTGNADLIAADSSSYDPPDVVDSYMYTAGNFERYTNTSSQIYHKTNSTSVDLSLSTIGFEFLTIQ